MPCDIRYIEPDGTMFAKSDVDLNLRYLFRIILRN
jgi:hypothetical protein